MYFYVFYFNWCYISFIRFIICNFYKNFNYSSLFRSIGDDGVNNDTHNETGVSEASGDITLDSVKDHMMSQSVEIHTTETPTSLRTERVETVSRTMESVSVVRSQLAPPCGEPPEPPSASSSGGGCGESSVNAGADAPDNCES